MTLQPERAIVPNSDSDSDEDGDRRRGRRFLGSASSDLSGPTCSTFLTPANKIIPESEDESSITPSSAMVSRSVKSEASLDSKFAPLMFNMDSDSDVEKEETTNGESKVTTATVAQQENRINPDNFHVDSDTDIEEEVEKAKGEPKALAGVTPQVSFTPVSVSMDRDPGVKEEDPSRTEMCPPLGNKVVLEHEAGSSTEMATPADFHMDSDTDAEDDDASMVAGSNPDTTAARPSAHPSADTHVAGNCSTEADKKTAQVTATDSDSDTDVEDSFKARQDRTAQTQNVSVAKATQPHFDSDTDLEDEPTQAPTVTTVTPHCVQPEHGAGTPHTDPVRALAPGERAPDDFRMDSDTEDEEEEEEKVEERGHRSAQTAAHLVQSSTPRGAGLSEEEVETQAFLSPTQLFKAPARPSLLCPSSPSGGSVDIDDFAVAETQSFVSNAPPDNATLDETPLSSTTPRTRPSRGGSSICLDLSDSSHRRPESEERTQALGLPENTCDLQSMKSNDKVSQLGSLAHCDLSVNRTPPVTRARVEKESSSANGAPTTGGGPRGEGEEEEGYALANSHLSTADTLLLTRSPKGEEHTQPYGMSSSLSSEEEEEKDTPDGETLPTELDADSDVTTAETQPVCEERQDKERRTKPKSSRTSRRGRQIAAVEQTQVPETGTDSHVSMGEDKIVQEEEPKSSRTSRRGRQIAAVEPTQVPETDADTHITVSQDQEERAKVKRGARLGRLLKEQEERDVLEKEEMEGEQPKNEAQRGREQTEGEKAEHDLERLRRDGKEEEEWRGREEERERKEREEGERLEKEKKEREEKERLEKEDRKEREEERLEREEESEKKERSEQKKEKGKRRLEKEKEREEKPNTVQLEREGTERERRGREEKERLEKENCEEEPEEKLVKEKRVQEGKLRLGRGRGKTKVKEQLEKELNEKKEKDTEAQEQLERQQTEMKVSVNKEREVEMQKKPPQRQRRTMLGRNEKEVEKGGHDELVRGLGQGEDAQKTTPEKETEPGETGKQEREDLESKNQPEEGGKDKVKPRRGRCSTRKSADLESVMPPHLGEGVSVKITRSRSSSSNSERGASISEEQAQDQGRKTTKVTVNDSRPAGKRKTATLSSSGMEDSLQGSNAATRSRSNSGSSERSSSSVITTSRGRGGKGRKSRRVEDPGEQGPRSPAAGRGRGRKHPPGDAKVGAAREAHQAKAESEDASITEPSVIIQDGSRGRKRGAAAATTGAEESPQPIPKTPRRSEAVRNTSQMYKILFTGVVDEDWEKVVQRLGGGLAKGVADMTHLVTDKVRRTVKFLCAVARGIPIVTPDWLAKSGKSGNFLSPNEFLVKDNEQEKKFNFSLQEALRAAIEQPLLQGFEIHVTPSVKPEPPHMREIIACCGARYLPKIPAAPKAQTVVVSCEEDRALYERALSLSVPVVSAEFLLTGILQQRVDLQTHAFSASSAAAPKPASRGRKKK